MTAVSARLVDSLTGNPGAGLALALGRRLPRSGFAADGRVLVATLAAYWILLALAARLATGPAGTFNPWGLVTAAGRFQLWLAVVLAIAWAGGAWARAAHFLVALLNGGLPVALVAGASLELAALLVPEPDPAFVRLHVGASVGWAWLVCWRACRLELGLAPMSQVLAGAAYAAALALLAVVLPRLPLFHVAQPAPSALDIEAVYYRQGALLDDMLAALAPQDPTRTDLYFVGVAPYAEEDVFVREIEAARDIVEQRLDLQGRTLTLVNHRARLTRYPLANGPNLRRVLAGLGEHIDRDHDIVFVYLTSHGHEHAALAAEFPPLAPNDLHAHELRAALDDAGILWRVVVVSACFSGSFIEQLRSPTTLVVTAAAAGGAAVGCSHENAWTYFGEAFFVDALAATTELIAAAHAAREHIERRERREGRESSRPQIVVGEHIAAQLARWRAP